jgi:hypothetical protein
MVSNDTARYVINRSAIGWTGQRMLYEEGASFPQTIRHEKVVGLYCCVLTHSNNKVGVVTRHR